MQAGIILSSLISFKIRCVAPDIGSHSLILVGGAETNAIWKRFDRGLPFRADGGQVGLEKRRWKGKHVYQAVIKNPLSPSRYALFMGGTETRHLRYHPLGMIYEGAYDFALWRLDGTDRRLVTIEKLGETNHQGDL
jgi:hypothetical protein